MRCLSWQDRGCTFLNFHLNIHHLFRFAQPVLETNFNLSRDLGALLAIKTALYGDFGAIDFLKFGCYGAPRLWE